MRYTLIALAVALGAASCTTPGTDGSTASRVCPALPGVDEILAMRDKRTILFGEMHGTAETPALFGDFVCHAGRQGPVAVGLEIPRQEQPALDRYMASRGTAADRAALTGTRHWQGQDGRASEAMLALVERLRAMRAAGVPVRVHAFVDPGPPADTQTPNEQRMAAQWRAALASVPRGRLVALVGNIHARRTRFRDFDPAAMHVPQAELFTIDAAPIGGTAWNCREAGCGAHPLFRALAPLPRGLHPLPDAVPAEWRYDRWLSPGAPFTASPPVRRGSGP